jgi:hypothetical protein
MPRIIDLGERQCPVCLTWFQKRKAEQKYCSPACQQESKEILARERTAMMREINGTLRFSPVSEATVEKMAPGELYCPVLWPSLLPCIDSATMWIMTAPEYKRQLDAGKLSGLYVERWKWGSKVSHVYYVSGYDVEEVKMVRVE